MFHKVGVDHNVQFPAWLQGALNAIADSINKASDKVTGAVNHFTQYLSAAAMSMTSENVFKLGMKGSLLGTVFSMTNTRVRVCEVLEMVTDAIPLPNKKRRFDLHDKTMVFGCLVYIAWPTDMVPDWIPCIGLLDDVFWLQQSIFSIEANVRRHREWKVMVVKSQ